MFWSQSKKVITDEKLIDSFLNRGLENVFPNKEFLKSKLVKGEKLSFYLGVDPTGPTLHLGHMIPMLKLAELQNLGHQIILLIGDFTAMIGDPTDKSAVRKQLTRDEVLENCKNYKEQAGKILNFSGSNKAMFKFNSDWLSKMNFSDVLELSSLVTVEQMLKRDMFEKRINEKKPIFIHEFMYPLMQGYDSVAMDVDGEIGGNDQTFNMLMGRDLIKTLKNKEKFVIATKLLVDSSGKKMGKTDGNAVNMDQSAQDIFGKVMSWSDDMIINAFEVATKVSMDDIRSMKEAMDSGSNPKEFKMRLAKEIISIIHDRESAELAEKAFDSVFKNKEVPENIQEIEIKKDTPIRDKIVESGVVSSNSDWKRLIDSNAITIFPSEEVIKDVYYKANDTVVLRIGKKRFIKIIAE
jgi:tyrosyl-tRNA synthetase